MCAKQIFTQPMKGNHGFQCTKMAAKNFALAVRSITSKRREGLVLYLAFGASIAVHVAIMCLLDRWPTDEPLIVGDHSPTIKVRFRRAAIVEDDDLHLVREATAQSKKAANDIKRATPKESAEIASSNAAPNESEALPEKTPTEPEGSIFDPRLRGKISKRRPTLNNLPLKEIPAINQNGERQARIGNKCMTLKDHGKGERWWTTPKKCKDDSNDRLFNDFKNRVERKIR